MTHEDFIAEVARRLEWPEEKMAGIIGTILDVVSAELKLNNPVIIEGVGTLKADIQPEYILVNPETKERHLMPPAVEVAFEPFLDENEENTSVHANFTPDESLYNELNIAFVQFEPTLLHEGVQFPGVPEIIDGEPEEDMVGDVEQEIETEPEVKEEEAEGESESKVDKESPHLHRSPRRELRRHKRTASVWIPIAGGIAIIVASLFFFKGERNSQDREDS